MLQREDVFSIDICEAKYYLVCKKTSLHGYVLTLDSQNRP